MASSMGMFTLLMAMLSGGATELLDFVPTDAYWKAKNVVVSAEALIAETQEPRQVDASAHIAQLGAGTPEDREKAAGEIMKIGLGALRQLERMKNDPDQELAMRVNTLIQQIRLANKPHSVRLLMAIRTLGEIKAAQAMPSLKKLLDSKEPFVAGYAARSIAMIEGKELPASPAPAAGFKSDLGLLPANVGVVAQVIGTSKKKLSIQEAIKQLPARQNGPEMIAQMTETIIMVADQIGNVRLDALTAAVADDVGNDKGFVILIARGEFDARAAGLALGKLGLPSRGVDGMEVYGGENPGLSMFFPSNERAVLMIGPAQAKLPVAELVAAIRQDKGTLMTNAAIAKLIGQVDPKSAGWAVVDVTPGYKKADVIRAFDGIVMNSTREGDLTSFEIKATGKDPKEVDAAVATVDTVLSQAKQHLPEMVKEMPAMQPVVDFVQSAKTQSKNGSATLTAQFKGEAGTMFIMPMMFMGSARATAPAVREAPPVQIQDKAQPDPLPGK